MAVIFRVLGQLEAYVDGEPVDLGGPRPRLLLARLIFARGATVSVDVLLDSLYGEDQPARALGTLHSYISNLRRILEPGRAPRTASAVLLNRPPGYALGEHEVDADTFTRLAEAGAYEEALRLWRGTPYEEFEDADWLRPEIERLREAHLSTRERHLARLLDEGRPHVVGELETLVRANPLREGLWELLALALYRLGRQAEALKALRSARAHLAEELGLDPGPGLRRLEASILAQDPALAPAPPVPVSPVSPASPPPVAPPARLVVGRAAQLERLRDLALEVERGRPGIAVVSGEPGIGKTWLAEAFADGRSAAGWRVAWGRCHETSGAPALWPWRQVVQRLSAEVPPGEEWTGSLRVLLGDGVPGAAPERPAETGEARFRLHRATAAYLDLAARDRPVLVVIDDLQWADSASLGLLSDLAVLLRGGVGVVITTRSGEGPAEVYDTLGMLSRHNALRLPLTGLDPGAVAELAGSAGLCGPDGSGDSGELAALTERTRGNPLFIRETLRLAEDIGIGRALKAVPEGLADVLRRRIIRLPAAHRAVIEAVAVVGDGTDPLVIAEIAGDDASEALDTAAGLRLLSDDGRFTHDLVRETVYGDIPARRRAALHLAALRALERRPGPNLAALARHALAAGPAAGADAVRWASATAAQASGRLAYADAAQWWRRAADAHGRLPGADPAGHVEILLNLVQAQLDAGDGYGAREARAEAVRASDGPGDPLLTARALTSLEAPQLWKFHRYGDMELQVVRRIEETLAALPEKDSVLRCRLLGCLGTERYDSTGDPRCDTATREALAMARRLVAKGEAGTRLLAITLNARYQGVHLPEYLNEINAIGEELVGLGMPGFELLGWLILERTRLELFDVAGADQAGERARTLIERLDLPWPRFQHLIWAGSRRLVDGDLDGADARYALAAEAGEQLNLWHTRIALDTVMMARYLHPGDVAAVREEVEELVGAFVFPSQRQMLQVLVAASRGDTAAVRELTRDGWQVLTRDFLELPTLCVSALAQLAAGDRAACDATYARLLPYEDRLAIGAATFPAGPVGYFLGLVATDPGAARAHLDAAAERCERAGLTWWAARARAARAAR
ncbi:BTAD domain-containing putative transcriptional regulator [Streptosporangium sp. NPDC002721]|uniref:BTAD domain-containing putative transcriptional regulator n=1 Tax=Streptosporangium sp. NPDC002721 TaxID=3366188 RepID=UPI003681D79F